MLRMRYDLAGPGPRTHAGLRSHAGARAHATARAFHLLPAVPALALIALTLGAGWDPRASAQPAVPAANTVTVADSAESRFGPLSAADRDFLVKVRLAGLWEGPTGRQAQLRSGNLAVRAAGIHLVSGHAELDAKVLAIGAAFRVTLPEEPNDDQKSWMAEMTNAGSPRAYDQIFVDRLRAAHGKVYGLVAQIRVGSRNGVIRAFAQRTMEVVLDHITMLERTGLVNWSLLPLPPAQVGGRVGGNLAQTSRGPMTDAERSFLRQIRQAGLWAGPSGQQAQQRAGSDAVRVAGRQLIDGHAELDAGVLAAGAELGVELPDEPDADQKAWLAELANAATPREYDQVFVGRIRAADGVLYALAAQVRAGTRNDLVRVFAQRTMEIVLGHIAVLERTGLVNFAALPPPPEPEPAKGFGSWDISPLTVVAFLILIGALSYAARVRFYRTPADPASTGW